MALDVNKGGGGEGSSNAPQTKDAVQGTAAIPDMDAALEKLKADTEAKASPLSDHVVDALDEALAGVRVPKDQQLYSFSCAANPNMTFWVYPNAVELRERDFAGRITMHRDDPYPMEVTFYQGRYTTNDERMAKLLEYHMLAWPETYGSIQSGMGSIIGLQARIKALRDKAAEQMTLGGMGSTANDEAIIGNAERMMQSDNIAGAERMILAIENMHAARSEGGVNARSAAQGTKQAAVELA